MLIAKNGNPNRLGVIISLGCAIALIPLIGCQRGEPWTIECIQLNGPQHRETADSIADVLRETEGVDVASVQAVHDEVSSTIYYGTYHRDIDPESGSRQIPETLKRDLDAIKGLVDDQGRRLFLAARMVPKPLPDAGHPEWNLENVNGDYSLQVAVFFPSPEIKDRKKAAVDYVEKLRKKHYETFYHHGPSSSIVTVGVFGKDAVRERGGRLDYSEEVRALQRKENFAYNLTNGAIWNATLDGERGTVRSLLVKIPKRSSPTP